MSQQNTSAKDPDAADVYIFHTSPIRRSNAGKDYFNATCQTNKEQYKELVCYKRNLHHDFTKAEQLQ
jgi:hypothetical protein